MTNPAHALRRNPTMKTSLIHELHKTYHGWDDL
jgi:hypothetical protein